MDSDLILPNNLEKKDLDFECPREIRDRIAKEIIDDWDLVARASSMNVSDTSITSILVHISLTSPEKKAVAVLDAWVEERGCEATCLKLAEALHHRNKKRTIEILCEEVIKIQGIRRTLRPSNTAPPNQRVEIEGQDIVKSGVECDVVTRMKKLDSRFRSLHGNILSELEYKRVPVRRVINSLTLLPIDLQQEYFKKLSKKLPDLRKEEEISDLFLHLNPLVNFIDHSLISYIIDQFGSNTLKKMMSEYSEDVLQFMKETTVKQLMDHWPGQQEMPPNFSKLRVKIDEDPTSYSLYRLNQLRKRYCCELKLTDVVLIIIGLQEVSSFIVEWLLPSALVPQLVNSTRKLDYGFYLHERILKVILDEKQIFPSLPESKSKVPAITALGVTDIEQVEGTDPVTTQLSSLLELPRSFMKDRVIEREEDTHPYISQPFSLLEPFMDYIEREEGFDSELQLSSFKLQRIVFELSDSSLYAGVGIVLTMVGMMSDKILSVLNFKTISLNRQYDFKTSLFAIAQSKTYPEPAASQSQPFCFVIAVFVTGFRGFSPDSLITSFQSYESPLDIVDDIIKPFLPQSAPHLTHIPKLFFVSSWSPHNDLDIQPPPFPDDDDANYCIAYHVAKYSSDQSIWMNFISDGLCSGKPVEDIIKESQSLLDEDSECLYTFSCLKDKLVLRK